MMTLNKTIFHLVIAAMSLLSLSVYAQIDSPQNKDGVHFATQTVVSAPAARVPETTSPATAIRGGRQSPLNDMALISTNKVVFNSLGIIVHNRNGQNVSIAIHDSKGRRVLAESFGAESPMINIKTNYLEAGAYIYSVMIGDSLFSRPFFVTHR